MQIRAEGYFYFLIAQLYIVLRKIFQKDPMIRCSEDSQHFVLIQEKNSAGQFWKSNQIHMSNKRFI